MKKIVLGLAAMALIFASCSKDEATSTNNNIANPNAVGFEMGTGKISRATSSTLTTLEGDAAGIGVYATYKSTPVQYINNIPYIYDDTESKWGWNGNDQLWPDAADYPINFYAYHPKSGTTLTSALTYEYTVGAVASQVDYLAANKTGITIKPSNAKAALDFKHIMSQIKFQVAVGTGVTAEVQSIAIRNVGNKATFNYATMAWNAAPAAGSYTNSYQYATVAKVANNSFTATTAADVTGDNGALILMPQDLRSLGWDAAHATGAPTTQTYIEVVYRVYETATGKDIVGFTDATDHPKYTELSGTTTGALYVKVGYGLPTNWEKNKSYTYILHLGDPEFDGGKLIDENFIDEDGDPTPEPLPVVNPETGEEKDVPDPIYNTDNIIDFILKVSDWETTTGIDL